MGQLRSGARLFVIAIILAGAAILAVVSQFGPWPTNSSQLVVIGFLVLAGTLADIWGISLHYKGLITTTLSTAINYAAVLLFGPAVGCLVAASANALSDIQGKRAWYKMLFNVGAATISVGAASLAYTLLNDGSGAALVSPQNALAIVAGGLAYLVVNIAIVSTIVGLCEGYSPWDIMRASYKGVTFQIITLVPLAALVKIVHDQNPWGLFLLLFPIILTHTSYQAYRQLQAESQRTMETLAVAVDRRDPYTYHHSERVSHYSEQIAHQMKLDMNDAETVVAAAKVHDLGKIGIESAVLLKPGALDPREWEIMKEHPRIGAEIIGQLPYYDRVRDLVAYHQERYDGKGYPYGVAGEKIPLGARIIAVADAYDAMTSDRPYRKALGRAIAMAELRKWRGLQFDPGVVDAFLAVLEAEEEAERAAARGRLGDHPAIIVEPLPGNQAAH